MQKKIGITDVAWNVTIEKNNSENELDVVFIKNNKLHILECKTADMNNNDGSKSQATLYKSYAIKESLGALASKTAIVSIFELDKKSNNNKPHQARAKDLNIKTFIGKSEIENIVNKIDGW